MRGRRYSVPELLVQRGGDRNSAGFWELEREFHVLPEQVRRRDPRTVRDGQSQTVLIEHRGMGWDPARRTPSGNRHCASVSAFCPKCQAS